ncbi:hypothetical protein D3C78_1214990 [compost metagenome]
MKIIFYLFIFVASAAARAGDFGPAWEITYGRWGHAPLYGFDVEIAPEQILIFEKNADDPPKGKPCVTTYKKIETYETEIIKFDVPEAYDAFVLEMNRKCGYGPYILMAIPRLFKCHARVSFYESLDRMPSGKARSQLIGGRPSYSAGYGLRFPERLCAPGKK